MLSTHLALQEIDMNKRPQIQTLALAAAAFAFTASASAQEQCFDFSGTVPAQRYTVGDSLNVRHANVTFKQYFTNGNPATAEARHAEAGQTQIAGGAPPELGLYLIGMQIRPNQPVTRLRLRVAQSISSTGGFANANIEVNGERHESPSGFAGMNGKTIGQPAKGRVQIRSSMAPHGDGNWQNGTLEMRAVHGHIETVTLGAHTWRADDFCFEK
jgi:hypothetical protein